jgi:hypothetical protein
MVMTGNNKYIWRSKISEKKFGGCLRLFAVDLDATQIAHVTGLNRNTINRYCKEIRFKVAAYCTQPLPLCGEVEIDEGYFGARRIKGRRRRGALRKTIVLGWRAYNGLVDLGYKKHFCVNHGNNEFVQRRSHNNGIDGFWGYAKTRLSRFRGMSRSTVSSACESQKPLVSGERR